QGCEHIAVQAGREAVRKKFLEVVAELFLRDPKRSVPARYSSSPTPSRVTHQQYAHLVRRVRTKVSELVPSDAIVLVVSKGDDALLDLGVRTAWHFPQDDRGAYAGFHPADSTAAIAHLEALRARGGQYLLIPSTSLWW